MLVVSPRDKVEQHLPDFAQARFGTRNQKKHNRKLENRLRRLRRIMKAIERSITLTIGTPACRNRRQKRSFSGGLYKRHDVNIVSGPAQADRIGDEDLISPADWSKK